jgi:DNA-binding transcriptional regulator LsrR (DeoR family)
MAFDYESLRLISRIATLYYREDKNQSEIGGILGISTSKVSRLLKQAREQGLVEVTIRTPFQQIFELEEQIEQVTGVKRAIVVPRLSNTPQVVLQDVGQAAANYLLEQLRDGDTICMGGGRSLAAMVAAVSTEKLFQDVRVVPSIGGVQGRHHTDVNNLAFELAQRLRAKSFQLHAPAFMDNLEEKESISAVRQVEEILNLARKAQVAIMGVGSIRSRESSYFQFTSIDTPELQRIIDQEGGVGEILARIINEQGQPCALQLSDRVVGIDLEDLRRIPLTIGLAALEEKALPIAAALRGGYLSTIITDEITAKSVLEIYRQDTWQEPIAEVTQRRDSGA